MKFRNCLILVLFLVISLTSFSESPTDKVWDIAFSPKYVWLAYSNGIVSVNAPLDGVLRRYDRAEQSWRTFTIEEIFGVSFEANVIAVATDEDDAVWVGIEPLAGHSAPFSCAYSHDEGETWTPLSTGDGIAANAVKCIEIDPVSKTVWLGHGLNEAYNSISRSTDGGSSWTQISPNSNYGIIQIEAYNNTVWAGADFHQDVILIKSVNNGESWEEFDESDCPCFDDYNDITDVYMVSQNEVHCSVFCRFSENSSSGAYCFTADGGETWTESAIQSYDEWGQTVTVDENGAAWVGVRFDSQYHIYRTENDGVSWAGFAYPSPLPYHDPFVIRYDKYADIVWAGFWSDSFTNYEKGWCWTDDNGQSWSENNPPAVVWSSAEESLWRLYD